MEILFILMKNIIISIQKMEGAFHCIRLLKSEGYRVKKSSTKFDINTLKNIEILVITNALSNETIRPIMTPTRSAFLKIEFKI